MKKTLPLFLFCLSFQLNGVAQIKLNEVAATNTGQITDYLSNRPDWIEIYNSGAAAINLAGYALSDNYAVWNKWLFPTYSLASHARVIVFASGLNITTPELHSNFKLSNGEPVLLFNNLGTLLDSISPLQMQPGHARARIPDGASTFCYTNAPTPNAANTGTCYTGYAVKPTINLSSGFYAGTQSVSIGGSNIRYTTNGALPLSTSSLYTIPISVSTTKVIRARTFASGKLPSEVVCGSYLINEPTQLPVVSIIAHPDDLFSNANGGVAAYDNYSSGDEVPCTVDYFNEAHQLLFKENSNFKIVGNYSVGFAQKSIQFIFDEEFGASGDPVNIFIDEKPNIPKMHGFRVRNTDDDACCARMRDPIVNRMSSKTHSGWTASKNVAVFINGAYWGHYSARELLNEDYCSDNYGSNKDRTNIIKKYYNSPNMVDAGSDTSYIALKAFLAANNMSNAANYAAALNLLDYENWVDYWAAEVFTANEDWYSSGWNNNTQLFNAVNPDVKWKFVLWDNGYSQYNPYYDALEDALGSPAQTPNQFQDMINSLLNNTGFKNYFINRFADLMNYHWVTSKVHQIITTDSTKLHSEITANYNRWDGQYQQPPNLGNWQYSIYSLKDFYTTRPAQQRAHINTYFNLNGQVTITLNALPAGAGKIKISTIIPDSYPWSGVYFNGVPVKIQALANPGYVFSNWSANPFITSMSIDSFLNNFTSNTSITANFVVSPNPSIAISEINYNSSSTSNSGDWIELYNYGTTSANLSNWLIRDDASTAFTIPVGTTLAAGQRLVFVNSLTAFQNIYPGVLNVIGTLPFTLSNGGDAVRLYNASGTLVKQVYFDDVSPWPVQPDGSGTTLENVNPALPQNDVNSWFSGCEDGSPGCRWHGRTRSPCDAWRHPSAGRV